MRQILSITRQTISIAKSYKHSKSLLHNLLKIKINKHIKVAIYLPINGEIEPWFIINWLKKKYNINIYLPVIVKDSLKFAKISKNYKKNRFNIYEPLYTNIIPIKQLNIIFIPLLGFDNKCNRLGMGCGFYDKALHARSNSFNYKMPKLYGLAFNQQQITLKPQPWDVRLDKIITPKKVFSV